MSACVGVTLHMEKHLHSGHLHLLVFYTKFMFSKVHLGTRQHSHNTAVSSAICNAALRVSIKTATNQSQTYPGVLPFHLFFSPQLKVHLTSSYNWCCLFVFLFFTGRSPASESIAHVKRVQVMLCSAAHMHVQRRV